MARSDAAAEAPARDILDSPAAGGRFLRGGGLRALAYAAAIATSIGAIPLVSRYLHAVDYGRYVTVTSLFVIVGSITEGGIANLGVREFSAGAPGAGRELMRSLLGLRIALSLLGAAVAIGFALAAGYPRPVLEGTLIAAGGLILANLQVTLSVPLTARLRLPWLALLDFVGPAATAVGLIICVLLSAPLAVFFLASALANVALLTITTLLVRGEVSLRPSFVLARWRGLLSESIVFAAATALAAVYFQLVVVAMSLLSSGHAVGIFSLAFRVLSVVNGIPIILVGSAFPILLRAARDDRARLSYAVQRLLAGNLLLGGWLSLLVIAAAPFAISVMGGHEYAHSAGVLEILGAGVPATFIAAVFAFALLAVRMYRALIAINAAMVTLAAVLCLTLIPPYGARGAAFVTLSLEVVLALSYGTVLLRTHAELRPSLALPARILLALALGFTAALALPLAPLLAAGAGSIVLALATVVLRAFPSELVSALRAAATRAAAQ